MIVAADKKMGAHHRFYEDNGKWVADHEASNKHNKNLTQTSSQVVWVFFMQKRLDKAFELVYTNSVVNREVIRNVVTRIKREIDTLDLWEVY